MAETKTILEATKSALGKEIELLKEKLQKKSDKLVSVVFYNLAAK